MKEEELITLAQKYYAKSASREEKQAVDLFFEKLQQEHKDLEIDLSDARKQRIRAKIQKNIAKKAQKPSFFSQKSVAIAAIFIGVIGIGLVTSLLLSENNITQTTARGEKREIVLADGSHVFLNSNSSITYTEDFTTKRDITLKGEAFFKVFHDEEKPFTVTTGKIKTRVLGTSFNINSFEKDDVLVSVNTGKVAVTSIEKDTTVFLIKNEQVVFKDNIKPFFSKDDSEEQIAWTKNIIVLHQTTLAKTAKVLENWYDVQIDFENEKIKEQTISGKFKEEKLENVLESLALIKHLKIEYLTPKNILIRENPSNE